MNDDELLRYSRQILLPEVGTEGQERLLASRALIIGLGGLGSPVALYLAAAGVGRLTLVDHDAVDLSNLQRQIAHTGADLGRDKVDSARDRVSALNPGVAVTTHARRLEGEALMAEVTAADVVLDCSDNFTTRYALNRACLAARTPLVSGAAIRMEGQVAVFGHREGGPCYRCLYRDGGDDEAMACSENGVLAPVVGLVGTIQATEAIKVLLGIGRALDDRLLVIDALAGDFRTLGLPRDPACPDCNPATAGHG